MSILSRLGRQFDIPALEALSPRDLNSLLLHVFGKRAADGGARGLLERFEQKSAARAIRVDARRLHVCEGRCYDAAADFEALALPPTLPLGAAHILGATHQNNVLSALRGLEVMADPTTWLGLEAARRLRDGSARVRLCCSQRVMRMQPLPNRDLLPHFQLFALVSAGGREDVRWLREHAQVWLTLLTGLGVGPLLVEVSDTRRVERALAEAGLSRDDVRATVRAHDLSASRELLRSRGIDLPRGRGLAPALEAEVLTPLEGLFPAVKMEVDLARLEGLGYYCGPTLRISLAGEQRLPFVDGGLTDWTGRLLERKGERMFASGIGLDLLTRLVSG